MTTATEFIVDVVDDVGMSRDFERLRTILSTTLANASSVPLADSLRQIAETACQIVGCGYGAIIIRDEDGALTHFVPVGVDETTAERVGRLPSDGGLLGEVIDDGRILRVPDIAVERGATGLPTNHPAIKELIGVPIRAAGELTGGLFLSAHEDGHAFGSEDEHAARVIATAAGFLVDRARTESAAQRRHRWLVGSTELTREIVAGVHADPMQVLVERALEVAEADLAAVIMPSADGESLIATSVAGERAHALRHRVIPRDGTITDLVSASRSPMVVERLSMSERHTAFVELVGVESALLVPMSDKAFTKGTLALFRYPGRRPFAQSEQDMASTFAAQMVLALELAEARADRERAALFAERERIARDLHDHVIQQLFALGMTLQSSVGQVDPQIGQRLHAAIDDLDSTILQIRSTIYRLTGPVLAGGTTLRSRAEDLLDELTPILGFPIGFDVRGPVDFGVADQVAEDVVAVLRETVTNVAKHAHATRVDVSLDVDSHGTTLTVADDGRGIGKVKRRSGLANLRARAVQHGGEMKIATDETGTRITWIVPNRQPA